MAAFLALCLLPVALSATIPSSCPDYATYSENPHPPYSNGTEHLPYMRPVPECRTFNSSAVNKVIKELEPRFKNPDLAQLFKNAFPNTLDTTIKWQGKSASGASKGQDITFVVTGDIDAEWLRDTYNQLNAYAGLLTVDDDLATMVKGTITQQARYISAFVNCGSFQPPPESPLPPQHNSAADGAVVQPPYNNQTVFECKQEIDSLGAFLALSHRYFQVTDDQSFVTSGNASWLNAISAIITLFEEEQRPTLDHNGYIQSAYNFTSDLDVVINSGVGPPQLYTGMVGTSFRPSDDKIVLRFNIPDNAFIAVELESLAAFLPNAPLTGNHHAKAVTLAGKATQLAKDIRQGIESYGTITHPVWGRVYAYEVDGYGSQMIMDDANNPSLLSLPYIGFLNEDDPTYQSTRKMILSAKGNPYYNVGEDGQAIGSPHTGIQHVWPMSLITRILTTDDEEEITNSLNMILKTTSGLGLIHESFYVHNSTQYTRSWFAWANSFFSTAVLTLAEERPSLIFTDDTPYKLPTPISTLHGPKSNLKNNRMVRALKQGLETDPLNAWM